MIFKKILTWPARSLGQFSKWQISSLKIQFLVENRLWILNSWPPIKQYYNKFIRTTNHINTSQLHYRKFVNDFYEEKKKAKHTFFSEKPLKNQIHIFLFFSFFFSNYYINIWKKKHKRIKFEHMPCG
jgi:hypothetical protein